MRHRGTRHRALCRYGRHPPPRVMASSWKARLHRCLAPPGTPVPRANHTHQSLVIINRPPDHGRSFLTIGDATRRLAVSAEGERRWGG